MDDVKQAFIEAEEEILDPDSLELEQFDERIANAYMKQVLLLQAKIVSIYDISQSEIERIQKIRDELLAKMKSVLKNTRTNWNSICGSYAIRLAIKLNHMKDSMVRWDLENCQIRL
jgi:hypothetical protein